MFFYLKININVSDILNTKLQEINNRTPLKINSNSSVPFEKYIESETDKLNTMENIKLDTTSLKDADTAVNNTTKTSRFPILTNSQLNELMPKIDSAIKKASQTYNVDERLIRAVINQESSFQPYALSTSGAMGLMQLMPDTAKQLGVQTPYNIEENIMGGTRYLALQIQNFDGNLELALAAYNAGPNTVKKFNGIPPYDETTKYVERVINSINNY